MLGMKFPVLISKQLLSAIVLAAILPFASPVTELGGATVAHAQTINAIRVEGNRRIEPETVRSYLQFSTGDRYDEGAVDESLKALFATGLFADVRIRRSGGAVIVSVVENPIINRVAFEGNSDVDDDTLKSEIQLKSRSMFTRARVQSDVQRILDVYRRQGMYAARVDPKIIQLEHNRVDLVYEISEGPDTKVKSINFIGNNAFTDGQLEDVITTTETGLMSFLKPTNIYDPDRLNLDRELLRQFYLKNGYADARVVSATADLDQAGNGFFITFVVEEGELYRFGEISLDTSLASVNPEEMRTELLTKTGDIYNASKIDKSVEKVTIEVSQQGYAFARVRPRVNRDPISRTIGINYTIEEGPRVYIERIDIVGNTRTLDYVIRREFRLAEGDAYNRLMVDRARRRLMGLGFFKNVKIARQPGSAPDRVRLVVTVIEQSTGELSFGAGYSTSEGVIGDISIAERNLLGKGQYVRLKFSGSIERAQVDFAFTEPRFLDRDLAAGFDAYHKELDYSSESSYKSRKTGGGVRLSFPLSDELRVTTLYKFVRDEVYDVEGDASATVKDAEGVSNVSALGYRIAYDTRNHKTKPSRGVYMTLAQDFAGVGGDVNYVRTIAEGRAYYPVYDKITLVGRVIGGNIFAWGGDDVRLVDLYYKGGETVRGFDRSGFGPRDAATDDALGGKTFYAGTVEVRFPLPFLTEEIGMSGAVFADAGTLYDAEVVSGTNVLDDSTIRASVGGSILWDSPVGPLRADFAYVLNKEDYDEEELFRFGASTKF